MLKGLCSHLSAEREQRFTSLASTASNTETAVRNNYTAIQALSSPVQDIYQALPLIQQQSENTAITINAVHDEAQDSRRDFRDFRERALQGLTNLANQRENSPRSLETTIRMALDRYSAGINELREDLRSNHSQQTSHVNAKMEALVSNVV